MNVELQDSFLQKLNRQVAYIAADKPQAARKFKQDILKRVKKLGAHPYQCKKSIYYDDKAIRDMVFKGYVVVYKVDEKKKLLTAFGLIKFEETL